LRVETGTLTLWDKQELLAKAVAQCAEVELATVTISRIRDVTRQTSSASARIETQDGESAVTAATLVTKSRIDPELAKLSLPPALSVEVGGCGA